MSKKYYVVSKEECQTCEGVGEVYNQAWDEFNTRFNEAVRSCEEPGAVDLPDGKAFKRLHGAEFRQCGTCEGTGTDTRQVELSEALAELGFTLGRLNALERTVEMLDETCARTPCRLGNDL